MCLILLAVDAHPDYPLVIAANRDEFYARPTAAAAFWDDAPHVLAGRDLTAGGSWLGITRTGGRGTQSRGDAPSGGAPRWAALTNYRDPPTSRADRPSRGALVGDFLRGDASPADYLAHVAAEADRYDGFNLLVGDPTGAYYFGNRLPAEDAAPRRLEPGVYGLSNHLLDTAWPKVVRGRRRLGELLAHGAAAAGDAAPGALTPDALLDLLYDTEIAPLHDLPDTGVDTELERALSASFIATPTYGTRASTAVIVGRARDVARDDAHDARDVAPDRVTFVERTFAPGPVVKGDVTFEVELATV